MTDNAHHFKLSEILEEPEKRVRFTEIAARGFGDLLAARERLHRESMRRLFFPTFSERAWDILTLPLFMAREAAITVLERRRARRNHGH